MDTKTAHPHEDALLRDPEYTAFIERIGKHQHVDMMQRTIYHVLFSKYIPPRHGEPYMPTPLTRNQQVYPPPTISLWKIIHHLHPRLLTSTDSIGWTPLHYLCLHDDLDDHLELLESLLQILTESDINNRDVVTVPAPIMILISRKNNIQAVQLMIQYGADINIRTRNKRSVFHYLIHLNQAIPLNTFDMIFPLISHQCNLVCLENKTTPLHTLCANHNIDDHLPLFELILNCYDENEINILDDNGVPPVFHLARHRNNQRALQLMVKHGANIAYHDSSTLGNILTFGHLSVYYIDKPTLLLIFSILTPRQIVRQRNRLNQFYLLTMLSDPPHQDTKQEQSEVIDIVLPYYTHEELSLGAASCHPHDLPTFIPPLPLPALEYGQCTVTLSPQAISTNIRKPIEDDSMIDGDYHMIEHANPYPAIMGGIDGGIEMNLDSHQYSYQYHHQHQYQHECLSPMSLTSFSLGITLPPTQQQQQQQQQQSQPQPQQPQPQPQTSPSTYIKPLVTPFSLLFKHDIASINLIIAFKLAAHGANIRTVSPYDRRNLLHILFFQSYSPPNLDTIKLLYTSILPDPHSYMFHAQDVLGMTPLMYFVTGPYIMNQIPALKWLLSLICGPHDLQIESNIGKKCIDLVRPQLKEVISIISEAMQEKPKPYALHPL